MTGTKKNQISGKNGIVPPFCYLHGNQISLCIPLKRIDAISVAEGLMDIFSHTGIPHEVLTTKVVYLWVDFALNCASC